MTMSEIASDGETLPQWDFVEAALANGF